MESIVILTSGIQNRLGGLLFEKLPKKREITKGRICRNKEK